MHFVFGKKWIDRDELPIVRWSRNVRLLAPEKFGGSLLNGMCYDGLDMQR